MGEVYYWKGDYTNALKFLEHYLEIDTKINKKDSIQVAYAL